MHQGFSNKTLFPMQKAETASQISEREFGKRIQGSGLFALAKGQHQHKKPAQRKFDNEGLPMAGIQFK